MKKWTGFRSELTEKTFDAIVIGSGISGLCTAAFLAKNGKRVLVLEKHFTAGGFTHTFKRKNYEWDVGIHYIGEMENPKSAGRRLFDYITDGKLQWAKMDDTYDKIIFPDKTYHFTAPREKFVENLISYFPEEETAICKYMELLDEAVKSGRSFFSNKALPGLMGKLSYPFMTKTFFSFADKSTRDVIMELTSNEKLLGVLTGQWGDHGLPPGNSNFAMHSFVARHYLQGGSYPVGGSGKIAETVTNFIESNGGTIAVNSGVDKIMVKNGRAVGVKLENEEKLYAPLIVSSAGVVNTFGKFLQKCDAGNRYKSKLNKINPTGSYLCLHIGLNKSAGELGLGNGNLWIYPSYDHDKNVAEYNQNLDEKFPVVFISFPSAKDPDWEKNHSGTTTIEAITMANYGAFESWKNTPWKKRGDEYEALKETLSQRILDVVYKHVPAIKDALDYYELSTPLTVKNLANYGRGELYGIDHTSQRFHQKWLKPKTDIQNLYLTGQDITTAGVTSALFSGLLTASTILKRNLFKELKS